jgi:gluconolactonase
MRHDDAFRMLNYPRPAVVKVALLTLLLAAACAVAVAQAPTPGPPAAPAPPPPAPKIAPSGTPAWTVDLMTTDGVALFGGRWRAMDARIVEATPRPNAGAWKVSYDLQPKAGVAEYDDSSWPVIDAAALAQDRRGGGGVFMTWYRIGLTMPQRIGDFDPGGATAVFHIVVDDYAEVWVDGQLPRALGKPSPNLVAGFNLPNRVVISDAVKPGERIQIAVLGMNGPISLAPLNPVFIREARVEFYR